MSNNKLLVIDRDGASHDLEWEPDQTLMEALRDNDLPVLGAPAAAPRPARRATSSWRKRSSTPWPNAVRTNWNSWSRPRGYQECGSRLSCQLAFSQELNGVTVTLAPEE